MQMSFCVACWLSVHRLKYNPLSGNTMGEQLRTSTQEKQTCAICLQTIRKNAVWWHVTECRHYFHYDCWHTYHKHECDRREGGPHARAAPSMSSSADLQSSIFGRDGATDGACAEQRAVNEHINHCESPNYMVRVCVVCVCAQ